MNNRYNRSYSHVLGSSVRQWKVLDLRRVLEHYNVRPHPRELKAELFIMLGQLAEQRRLTIRDRWTALDAAEVSDLTPLFDPKQLIIVIILKLRAEQERERCPRCWRQNIVAEGRNRVVCKFSLFR